MVVNQTIPSLTLGTHYPNRLFVGALPGSASATDLAEFFKKFGTVLEGKVVLDNNGNSRRFGFITFATNEDVKRVLSHGIIFFRGKQINIGPAVKRMGEEILSPASATQTLSPVSATQGNCTASPGQCARLTPNQLYNLHQLPEQVSPPVSPSTPISPPAAFFRFDQQALESMMPNMPISPTYLMSYLSVSPVSNANNQQLPCLSVPYIGTSQFVPYGGPLPQQNQLPASLKPSIRPINVGYHTASVKDTVTRPVALRLPSINATNVS